MQGGDGQPGVRHQERAVRLSDRQGSARGRHRGGAVHRRPRQRR